MPWHPILIPLAEGRAGCDSQGTALPYGSHWTTSTPTHIQWVFTWDTKTQASRLTGAKSKGPSQLQNSHGVGWGLCCTCFPVQLLSPVLLPLLPNRRCSQVVCGVYLVAKSRPALCNCKDCSLLGSSVHGISQARILKWVAISFFFSQEHPSVIVLHAHTLQPQTWVPRKRNKLTKHLCPWPQPPSARAKSHASWALKPDWCFCCPVAQSLVLPHAYWLFFSCSSVH